MNDKSHVSLEQRVCLVCGTTFDTGCILLDKRLRASMKQHTTTGWGLSTEHQRLFDEGYVALVECDPQRSGILSEERRLKPENAYRTGQLEHVKRTVSTELFSTEIADSQACVFVGPGVIELLQTMMCQTKELGALNLLVTPSCGLQGGFFLVRRA
ncbi:ATPase [Pectobacterium sp. CHL-2024]|uniref:ATPase n=1 Tax=Pectobacterium sp. CHL-2024 TaxID=3377079 RepID=UPI00380FDE21